jgi:hypothetical protein
LLGVGLILLSRRSTFFFGGVLFFLLVAAQDFEVTTQERGVGQQGEISGCAVPSCLFAFFFGGVALFLLAFLIVFFLPTAPFTTRWQNANFILL